MRCACIDIGSNTTRLLVADVAQGRLAPVVQQRSFTRIGRAISAVTVRSVAVDDEERVGGVRGQIPLVDLSVRQTDGTGHVPFRERLWRTHVEQDEALRVAERGMDSRPDVRIENDRSATCFPIE